MVKAELMKEIKSRTGIDIKEVSNVMSAFAEIVTEVLTKDKDEKIPLSGLGVFKVKEVSERSGVSALGDKKPWVKPAHSEICFKITKSAREFV